MQARQKELAKTTAILTFGKFCTQFVSFLLLPLYTAILNPEEYGIVDLLNTYVMLLVTIVNLKYDQGIFRFLLDIREDKDAQKTLFSSVMSMNFIQSAAYAALFLCASPFIHTEYKFFLLVNVILNVITSTLLQFARGIGKNANYAFGSFLTATSTVLLNILFIVVLRIGSLGLFLSIIGGQILLCGYLFFSLRIWKWYSIRRFDRPLLREVTRYSLPMVPAVLSWWIIGASNRTFITNFISIAANGIYSVASKFSALVNTFFSMVTMAWTESVSLHIDDDDRDEFLTDSINTMFNLFAGLCIGMIAAMPFVFPLMVDAKYNEAYPQIPILMIAMLFQIVCGLYSVVYLARKNSKESAKTALFAAIINVVVILALIRHLGLYAASTASLVAYLSMAIYRYVDVNKQVKAPLYKRNILSAAGMLLVVIPAYFLGGTLVQAAVLLLTVVYVVLTNAKTLRSLMNMVLSRFKKAN